MQTVSFGCKIKSGDKLIGSDNVHYNLLEFGGPSMTNSNIRAHIDFKQGFKSIVNQVLNYSFYFIQLHVAVD